jgi:hypothetical protein
LAAHFVGVDAIVSDRLLDCKEIAFAFLPFLFLLPMRGTGPGPETAADPAPQDTCSLPLQIRSDHGVPSSTRKYRLGMSRVASSITEHTFEY